MGDKVMHPFEVAGLGKAPFHCTHITKQGAACNYCGTAILYRYWIKSSDGREFYVGCDCVLKTRAVVENFKRVRSEFNKQRRQEKRALRLATWAAANETRRIERLEAFKTANPEIAMYLESITDDQTIGPERSFLLNMRDAVRKWGSLTVGQMAALMRMIEQAQKRNEERITSQFFGTVGERITGRFEIMLVRECQFVPRFYGEKPSNWYLLKMGQNVCTYRGTSRLGLKGETFEATFTVKGHTEYEGVNQTVLSRPFFKEEPKS